MKGLITDRIPTGWIWSRFRYLADIQKGRLPPHTAISSDKVLPYLSMEYLRGEVPEPTFVAIDETLLLAEEGDILLLWDGANAGEFLFARKGVVSSTVARVVPKGINKHFLYWACKGQEFLVRSETVGMGIPHVNADVLANLTVPIPPRNDQQAIADYLDGEIEQIDQLVAAKQRFLAVLTDKQGALVARILTRGIDAGITLRETGIDWLGKIPARWTVSRVKYLFRLITDAAPEDNDYELLALYTDIGVRPRKDMEARGNRSSTTDGYWMVRRGDLVVNKLLAWMGAFGVSDFDGVTSPAYDVLRPSPKIDSMYYHFLFRCGICFPEFRRRSSGIMDMRLRLYFDQLGDMPVPVPPLDEQRAIVSRIAAETGKLDAIRAATEKTITLLKERRAALISAVVTGQMEVA